MINLRDWGIQTSIHYPPVHLFSLYRKQFGYKTGMLPMTEAVSQALGDPSPPSPDGCDRCQVDYPKGEGNREAMELKVFETPGKEWDEFASQYTDLIFYQSVWSEVLKKGLGGQPLYFYLKEGERDCCGTSRHSPLFRNIQNFLCLDSLRKCDRGKNIFSSPHGPSRERV